ncbi:hypothetical protein [Dyella mobilis]|uniref:Uncharacterized protein n=1 Tax=Dyella mobilis TaxID=1849582 RepID=A0ABS2KGL5_9GAMM|nr:hypothetical protein [Dyella mobilis]MBM7130312.1 hypothetical protein [Dyella mobilis]
MAHAADKVQLFDPPLSEQHQPLPADPLNPQTKPALSCFYYPHLMVKQVDMGEVGAEQLSILFVENGKKPPACRRENARDEKVIGDWSGYFRGVRAEYVFFAGADGANGGTPFAVFNPEGEKLFADTAVDMHSVKTMRPPQPLSQRPWYENPLELDYRRVYLAPCSMRSNAQTCWSEIRQATGLSQAAPDCSAAYAAQEKTASAGQLAELRADPSVVEYEVHAVLDGRGVIQVTPVSPALACYPAE